MTNPISWQRFLLFVALSFTACAALGALVGYGLAMVM